MVTMAQSAANWCNTQLHVDRTHSLTQLLQHSYNHLLHVRSASSVITELGIEFLFLRCLLEVEQTGVPEEKKPQPTR